MDQGEIRITHNRNERGSGVGPTDTKRIMRECAEGLHVNVFGKPEEMDLFLERPKLLELPQEEV